MGEGVQHQQEKEGGEETLDELPEEEEIDDSNNIEPEDGNWRRVGECPCPAVHVHDNARITRNMRNKGKRKRGSRRRR